MKLVAFALSLVTLCYGGRLQHQIHLSSDAVGASKVSFSGDQYEAYAHVPPPSVIDGQLDPYGTLASRVGPWYTTLSNYCCQASSCNGNLCKRSCPASCSWQGWNGNPSLSIKSFQLVNMQPATYTPTLIQPQNYTNYNKNNESFASWTYSEQYTDSVTVTQTTTLTTSLSVTAKADLKIMDVESTVSFTYDTSQSTSTTKGTAKTWQASFGPNVIPPCHGLAVNCYVLAANFNPDYTAVYQVTGVFKAVQCAGNYHYDTPSSTSDFLEYGSWAPCGLCSNCTYEPSMDTTVVVNGKWNGVFGAAVDCSSKPYPLPESDCS